MAEQITAYRAKDGSIHATEEAADRADAQAEVRQAAERFVEGIGPCYGKIESVDLLAALIDPTNGRLRRLLEVCGRAWGVAAPALPPAPQPQLALPTQPLHVDKHGAIRCVQNTIVRRLLDTGPFDMNAIMTWKATDDERAQFAQLIGYSLGGLAELSYVPEAVMADLEAKAEGLRSRGR